VIEAMDRPDTVSIGVCAYPASTSEDVTEMLSLADSALYRAKANGRNRVEVAGPPPGAANDPDAASEPPGE
jgi:diguanylate cyclase (GGDEF)-like protein